MRKPRRGRGNRKPLSNNRRGHQGEASEGSATNADCADHREDHLPGGGRHTEFGQAMRGAVARDGGRHGVQEGDRGAYCRRANCREHDLPDCQSRTADTGSNQNRSDHAGATMKGGHAGRDCDEKWQGVNGQGKEQAEQSAEAEQAEDDAKCEHDGKLRTIGCTVAPPPPPWREAENSGIYGLSKHNLCRKLLAQCSHARS